MELPRGDASDAREQVQEQMMGASTSTTTEEQNNNEDSETSIHWQMIVGVRLADFDELPYRISCSILAEFKLGMLVSTTNNTDAGSNGVLKDFLLQHIAVFTSPNSNRSERRKSLDTVKSFFARIDEAKENQAGAAPAATTATTTSGSVCPEQAGANTTESSSYSRQVDTDRDSSLAGQQLVAAAVADGEEQSVPAASDLCCTNNMEDASIPQSTMPPLDNRAERECGASTVTEHAEAVQHVCSGHDNDCVEDRAKQEVATGTGPAKDMHYTTCLGPKDIVIGPLYAKIDTLAKALLERTVNDYAPAFSHAHTTEAKKDVCWRIYSLMLAHGIHFLQQGSGTSALFVVMEDGDILELLQKALSRAVHTRAKKRCFSPTVIDAHNQKNPLPSMTVKPTAAEQPSTSVRKISRSQITKHDVLMIKHCALPGNLYFKEQHDLPRKQGYDHHSCASIAISKVHQAGGRFLKPADASGALWTAVGKSVLLESIKKKKSLEGQPEKDPTTAGNVLFSINGQPVRARTALLAPRTAERERFGEASRLRYRCTERDVLLGNFAFASSWPGNKNFAQLLDHYGRKYAHCHPDQKIERKSLIAREAISDIIKGGGLFLQHYKGKTGPEILVETEWFQVDQNDVERSTYKLIPDADTQPMYQDNNNGLGACSEVGHQMMYQDYGDEGSAHSYHAQNGQFPTIPVAANGHGNPLRPAAFTHPPDGAGALGNSRATRETKDPEVVDLSNDFDT